jgi:hypothetical protein
MSTLNDNKQINLVELIIKCREWFYYLLKRWKIIVLAGIIGGGIGLTLAFMSKPTYTAALTFALEDDEGGGLSGALSLASQFGFDLGVHGGGAFVGDNLTELFKSRSMVEKTLLSPVTVNGETISFAEMYIRDLNWRSQWIEKGILKNAQFLPYADRSKFTREQDSVIGAIYGVLNSDNLKVGQKEKEVEIITIELKSGNELFAKNFTEALAKTVSDFYIAVKNRKARENLEILEHQTDSVRRELNGAIYGVAVANDNTFGLNPALNVQRVPSTRKEVDVQANGAMLVELVKQTEIAKVALRKETPLIQVIDRPILPLKKEKLGKGKGIVLFGFLAGFLIVLILLIKRFLDTNLKK